MAAVTPVVGESTALIPLRRRDGSVRAWALVDAEDYDRLVAIGAWSFGGGYAHAWSDGRNVTMSRVVLGLGRWAPGEPQVDHRNRDRLDNRKSNLRLATLVMNRQNSAWPDRGVGRHPSGGWRARVVVDGHERCKRCATRDEARRVVRQMRAEFMPYSPEAAGV